MKRETVKKLVIAVALILTLALCGCSGSGLDHTFSDKPTATQTAE